MAILCYIQYTGYMQYEPNVTVHVSCKLDIAEDTETIFAPIYFIEVVLQIAETPEKLVW